MLHLLIRPYAGYRKHYKQNNMEMLMISHTVQPEEKLTVEQWMEQYFAGARLKPEVNPFASCPLEAYLSFIDNTLNANN